MNNYYATGVKTVSTGRKTGASGHNRSQGFVIKNIIFLVFFNHFLT